MTGEVGRERVIFFSPRRGPARARRARRRKPLSPSFSSHHQRPGQGQAFLTAPAAVWVELVVGLEMRVQCVRVCEGARA